MFLRMVGKYASSTMFYQAKQFRNQKIHITIPVSFKVFYPIKDKALINPFPHTPF